MDFGSGDRCSNICYGIRIILVDIYSESYDICRIVDVVDDYFCGSIIVGVGGRIGGGVDEVYGF